MSTVNTFHSFFISTFYSNFFNFIPHQNGLMEMKFIIKSFKKTFLICFLILLKVFTPKTKVIRLLLKLTFYANSEKRKKK
jgi:hypothetical protein